MTRSRYPWLAAILLGAFLVRGGYSWKFPQWGPGGTIPSPDHYARLAQTVLDHGALLSVEGEPTPEREPGYPLFLAFVFFLHRSYRFAQLAQCLLGVATVWLVYRYTKELLESERAGLLAAAMAAFHPQLVYYSGLLYRETWIVFLAAASLYVLLRAARAPSANLYAAAGAVTALGPLSNTAFFPFAFAGAPAAILWLHRADKSRLKYLGAFLAALIPLYGIWVARNYYHFDRLIPGATTGGGGNLYYYQIVPPEAAGTPEQTRIMENDPVTRKVQGMEPVERESALLREGLRLIAERPFRYLRLVLGRVFKLWRPHPYARDYGIPYPILLTVSLLSDGWIIPLALFGAFLLRLRRPELSHAYLFILLTTALYAAVWAMLRYRLPLMIPVFALAAYPLDRALQKLSR